MRKMRIAGGLVLALTMSVIAAAHAGGSSSTIPDGVYRAYVTSASLLARGVDAQSAIGNSGVQTLIFHGSRWTNRTTRGTHREPDCSGDLSYHGARVTLTADSGPQCGEAAGGLLFSARWSIAGRVLRFRAVKARAGDPVAPALFGGRRWKKIG